ncbi:jerky protein homolog [Octopus sinensis]|uniref:Jerky protein homolog n=1 Tax=Octopus sinensis TaxID=2607531 RepID=A0A6P7TDA8_9MOLL|nr:jerky protein homolog [Octopus sinensis]
MSTAPEKQKRKRITLRVSEKLEIIKKMERGIKRSELMTEYNIGSSTLYDIKNSKQRLLDFTTCSEPNNKVTDRKSLHKPKCETVDKILYEWYLLQRSEGVAVSGSMLLAKAKDFKEKLGLNTSLIFSDGWLTRFKMRHGIGKLDLTAEKQPRESETAIATVYSSTFDELVNQYHLTPDQIYNADETCLYWKCLPEKISANSDEANASFSKYNKERLAVLMCANASGQHRLKLLVIGKLNRPKSLKGIMNLPVSYKTQKNAWMDKELFQNWFTHEFVPAVRLNLHDMGKPANTKCVLLLYNSKCHPLESKLVSDCGNIFACYLPANVNHLAQPMDQGIIQNFKCYYRNYFIKQLIYSELPVPDFQRQFTIKDALFGSAIAWTTVKSVSLLKAWKKFWPVFTFGPLTSDDGTEDDFDGFNVRQCTKEIMQTIQKTPLENPLHNLEDNDIEDWITVDNGIELSQISSDQDIADSVVNPENPDTATCSEDNDEEDGNETVSWSKAQSCMDTILSYFEQNPCFSMQQVMQAHMLKITMVTTEQRSAAQNDIKTILKKAMEENTSVQ